MFVHLPHHYDQAIDLLTSTSFDIIFIDIGLSGKSGEDLITYSILSPR